MTESQQGLSTRVSEPELVETFFRQAELAPDITEEAEPEIEAPPPPSPEVMRRRWLFRISVGFIVVGFAVFTTLAWRKGALRDRTLRQALAARPPTPTTVFSVPPPPTAPQALTQPTVRTSLLGQSLLGFPLRSPKTELEKGWQAVESHLRAAEWERADNVLEGLCKSKDRDTRETARLGRAILWRERGRAEVVRAVFADLSSHARSPLIRERAREALKH